MIELPDNYRFVIRRGEFNMGAYVVLQKRTLKFFWRQVNYKLIWRNEISEERYEEAKQIVWDDHLRLEAEYRKLDEFLDQHK